MCKNYDSRKRSLVTTLVVLAVCLVVVTGSTFSLFTSNSKVNIAVTSGSVKVTAILDESKILLSSMGEEMPGLTFENGGKAELIAEDATLKLINMTPGDSAAVTIDVTNESNVNIAYRLILTITGELASGLDIDINTPAGEFNYGYTSWIDVPAGEEIGDIKVTVTLPKEAGNEYQGLPCNIGFVLEAVQGNADVVDPITYNTTTGVYEVNSEEGMMLMNNIINTVSHGEGRPLKFALTADMDMTGYTWTPVALLFVDIDGQGHTISNLNCGTDDWGRSGFAGYAGGANISNLTFENVAAVGTQAGIIAGAIEGNCVSNVTIKGANSVKYDYAINPQETWGGAGVIAGVASYLNPASTIVIADGATVNVEYNGLVTSAPVQNEYAFISDISGVVTNNGTVTTTGTSIIIEAGLGFIYGDNGEKTLHTITDAFTGSTLVVPERTTGLRNKYLNGNTTITEVVIPAGLTNFGGTANAAGTGASGGFFYGSAVEKVTLPEGITEIPAATFNQAANLKEVNIPSSVTTIGINAFAGSGLTELTIPATVTSIGYGAFRDMANLTTVTIEGNVNIPVYAFRACANLKTVILTGDDVTFGSGTRGMIFTNNSNGDGSDITIYVANETVKERLLAADTAANDYGGYNIVVSSIASSGAELDDAIAAGKTTIVLGSGNYIIPDSAQGKTLTIIGNGETVVATQNDGSYEGCDYSLDGATVTFKGITINTDSTTYTGYARLKATYIDCTINGTYTLYDASTFENCTFNVSGDVYNIWTWGAPTATFTNCTFNTSGKAILLYGGSNTVLTVTNCTFNDDNAYADVNNKAAIEVGSDWTTDTKTIIATNCTVNGFDITTKGDNTGTTLWGDKNSLLRQGRLSVTIDGATVVSPAMASTLVPVSNSTYLLTGDFAGANVCFVMPAGVENVVFDGTGATNINELIIIQNGKLIDNANDAVGERSGKVTVKNFAVLSQINVFACKTEVEVCYNAAEAMMVYAGNCALNIHHNVIDSNFESHPTYRSETTTWNNNDYGIALNIFDYELWFDNNTVKNTLSHVVGINGWEGTFDTGDANVIHSFTGNTLSVDSTKKTGRAALKVWDDETYASNDENTNVVNADAQALINTILAAESNNTITVVDGQDHVFFSFYNTKVNK